MIVFAYGYRQQVGKDQACRFLMNYLRDQHKDKKVCRVAFADVVKEQTYQTFGWAGLQQKRFYEIPSNAKLKEKKLEGIDKTPREIWIEWAELLKGIHPAVWVDYVIHNTTCDIMVLSDLRYVVEAKGLEKYPGVNLIRIDRPGSEETEDCDLGEFDGWDYVLDNNGTLAEFHNTVVDCAKVILEK